MSNPAETTQEVKKDDDTRIMDEIEKDTLIELETGMSGEREQLLGMPKEYSGWDVYNNEAKKVDTELVNDLRDSLNSLLLFAAIFAAVLTAFIIESKKLLESDSSDAMLDVMIFFTNSMANGTFTPYSRPQFEPESSSITINCLFFASLSVSLVAALASVVALQWVADYDAAMTRGGSSPEDRAKRRQFRYAGVVWWKMGEIIAALPLLLYSSVVLLFSGLTLWMWTVHHTVGAVVAGGMAIAVLFYGATTFVSVASVSAPFRTPLSRLIYSSVYLFFSIVDSLSRFLPIPSSQAWLKERHQRYTGAVKRDNDEAHRRDWLGVDALSWLASHLSISLDSYDRLLLLVNELRKQDPTHFVTPRFNEAPWFSIFDLLAWRNFKTAGQDDDTSKEEVRAVAILAHNYRIPTIYAIIRPKEDILYCSDDTVDEYWSQGCDIARAQWSPPSPSVNLNSLFLLFRDIPLPSKDTAKQMEFTIRLSRWRNSPRSGQETLKDETRPANAPLSSSSTSVVVVDRFLEADEDNLWFTRDERSQYQTVVGRRVKFYVENEDKMAPYLLDTLRRRFESLLLGEDGHAMDAISCLSRPLRCRTAFKKHKIEYSSLHSDFTLLLARNLNSFFGAELTRRVKEVLTMMWVSSVYYDRSDRIHERQGMENFFDANWSLKHNWVYNLAKIPHSFEILEYLSLAQARQPDIGSLWRVIDSQATLSDLSPALEVFDNIIIKRITPEQHFMLIDLICRDVELSPPDTFRTHLYRRRLNKLTDPCLRFIWKAIVGAKVEFPEDMSLFKASWDRVVKHIMNHYKGTGLSTILMLQASAWNLTPYNLCRQARREPQTLRHLMRVFEYSVQCHQKGHDIGEGHLLLHVLYQDHEYLIFPVDIPVLTELPMKGTACYSLLLMALVLSDGYEEPLRKSYKPYFDERCTNQLLEILSTLRSYQYSMLATVVAMGFSVRYGVPQHLAAFSICINKALDLPDDLRSTSLIRPLMNRVQVLIRDLSRGSASQQAIARHEATKTIERLNFYLALLSISGTRNCRMLSCARTAGAFSPATGWLAPYTD